MPRWARILLWSTAGLLAFFVYLVLFGCQTLMALEMRYLCWGDASVWSVPADLMDQSISKAAGQKLSYEGFEFEVPWRDEVDSEQSKRVGPVRLIEFKSGRAIIFEAYPSTRRTKEMPGLFGGDIPQMLGIVAGPYGIDYAVDRYMLEVTPADLSPFSSRRRMSNIAISVSLKPAISPNGRFIYQVQTPVFAGFQFGDPVAGDARIRTELYSAQQHISLVFRNEKPAPLITQPEINRILQSMRPIGEQGSRT